jgi:hypothetical protein
VLLLILKTKECKNLMRMRTPVHTQVFYLKGFCQICLLKPPLLFSGHTWVSWTVSWCSCDAGQQTTELKPGKERSLEEKKKKKKAKEEKRGE